MKKMQEAIQSLLIADLTSCGGNCGLTHGKDLVDPRGVTVTVTFSKAVVVNGVPMPICDRCALTKYKGVWVPLAEAMAQAEQYVPPAPKVEAKPAEAPQPQPSPARPQQRPEPRKEPQPKRPVELPPAVASHLKSFEMATKFEKAIGTREEGRCSARCCSAKAGEGFVVRDDKQFPLCDAGLRAAGIFSARCRDAGQQRPFFYYRSEKELKERQAAILDRDVAKAQARQAHNAKISQEILDRRFADTSKDVCTVIACETPKPRMEIRIFDAKLGDDVRHPVCDYCARVAVDIDRKLSREQRFFSVARPGEKRPAPRPQRKPQPRQVPQPKVKAPSAPPGVQASDPKWKQDLAVVMHDMADYKKKVGATPPPVAAEAPPAELPTTPAEATPVEISQQTPVEETGTKSQEGDSTIN